MGKIILLAAAAVVGVGTIATAYYITPIEVAASETPAILVDASPAEVLSKIRAISLDQYLIHAGADVKKVREASDFYVQLSDARVTSDSEILFDLMRGDDQLGQFKITLRELDGGKSEVDVETLAGESRFSANPEIHPYDIELVLSVADFLATDYISSLLKGHPMLTGKRLGKVLEARYGLEEDEIGASYQRMERVFWETYAFDLKDEMNTDGMAVAEAAASAGDFDSQDQSEPATDADADVVDVNNAADVAARAADEAIAAAERDAW